jgi:hypothetical protein
LEQCKLPSSVQAAERKRRLGGSLVKLSVAEKTCRDHMTNQDDFDACVFDVLLTGDMEVASAY